MRLQIRNTQSVAILASLSIAAILVSVAVLILGLRERELKHARLEMISLTEMLMAQTEQNFKAVDLALLGVQERLNTAYGSQLAYDSLPIHLLLTNRLSGIHQLRTIFLVDERGMIVNSSNDFPVPQVSVADRDYFSALASSWSNALYIDKPVRSRKGGSWSFHLSRTLIDVNGKFRGVVVATIGISKFEQIFGLIKLDYDRPIGIYLADGTLIASLPHREGMIGDVAPELRHESLPTKGNEIRSIRHTSGDGGKLELAVGRAASYPLLVSVAEDENLALASWRETAAPIAIVGIFLSIFTGIVAMVLIGKQKKKEALTLALEAATHLYQHTVDSVMDAIVAIDEAQNIVLFNPAAENMFGYAASDILGKPFETLIPERYRHAHAKYVHGFSGADTVSRTMAPQLEITGRRADGSEFPIESTVSKSLIGGKLQMTAVLRDVTEHRRNEIELRALNSQLRDLSASLQSVREQERTRLSRELHDELGQQLTGLKLSFSWLGKRLKDGRAPASESIDEMRQQLNDALSSVRRISTELRPLILDDLGFFEALSWHCSEFEKRSNIKVLLNAPGAELINTQELATAIFRIVQESLTNVARHAHATQVKIDLLAVDENLRLTISDNGQGMLGESRPGGIGLVSMRERAIAIGATFSIISSRDKGTTIELTLERSKVAPSGATA